ncbi:UNKNOWN [Stylonychia lemnae]|uniref:Uncharacterized protein n=1 Tax=Stylonychia lemnae TaxID=5949 RepID=A0A077ZT03_STYLE|nr:UNKNOWN [Stylonychia lemnae]|eukprot:CDW72440.1 UNKNOWN [Stylonychia lemnae]
MSGNLLRNTAYSEDSEQLSLNQEFSSGHEGKKTKQQALQQMTSIKIYNEQADRLEDELVILEFQGDFEHSNSSQYDDLNLGSMRELQGGNYELQVGNHMIKGKLTDLPKALLFTEKVFDEFNQQMEYRIKAIIKKKVVFSSRPTPLRTVGRGEEDSTKRRKLN